MQQNGPKDIGFFGTRNMGFMHQQLIEVLSYAMVLTVRIDFLKYIVWVITRVQPPQLAMPLSSRPQVPELLGVICAVAFRLEMYPAVESRQVLQLRATSVFKYAIEHGWQPEEVSKASACGF